MQFVTIEGRGDPNEAGGAYQQALAVLYAVSYTLKMSPKAGYDIPGFFGYVVPPLEGFWRQEGGGPIDYANKGAFCWVSAIRLPDFITEKDLEWAKEQASRKKKLDCSAARLRAVHEGLCVQMLHQGPYDAEPASLERMEAFLEENGYVSDVTPQRPHHEIYLTDPRRTPPEKWRTVLRQPIKQPQNSPLQSAGRCGILTND